jgi:hypothetical protein
MRVGILANSYLVAFKIYEQLHDLPECELFVLLSPLPGRSAWLSILANFARMILSSMSPSHWQLSSVPSNRKVVFLPHAIDHKASLAQLHKMKLDVGLDRSGSNYSDSTTSAFRYGILRVRIKGVSSDRFDRKSETSLRLNDPINVTVFFADPGHHGRLPVVSEDIDFSQCKNLTEANQHLSQASAPFFRKALMSLSAGEGLAAFLRL